MVWVINRLGVIIQFIKYWHLWWSSMVVILEIRMFPLYGASTYENIWRKTPTGNKCRPECSGIITHDSTATKSNLQCDHIASFHFVLGAWFCCAGSDGTPWDADHARGVEKRVFGWSSGDGIKGSVCSVIGLLIGQTRLGCFLWSVVWAPQFL